MATRNTRASKTATKTPVAEAVEVETKAIPEPQAEPNFSWDTYMDALRAQIPDNWKRHTIAIISGLIVSVGIGYAVGWATIAAVIGASALGAGAFMQSIIWALGLIINMYIGYKASTLTYTKVMDHSIDKVVGRGYARMRGMFTPAPKGATA